MARLRFMRQAAAVRLSVCAWLLAWVMTAPAVAGSVFEFVALGDLPYGPHEKAGPAYRALIAAINRQQPAFSIHVGDIKSGASACSDEEFERQRAHFSLFEGAVVYTPGDNEWTDCHRPSNGRFDPLERLQALRQRFFLPGRSLGQKPLRLESQSALMPAHARYVENQRWWHEGVLFLTVHVVGSHNNLDARRPGALTEFREREAANIAWLQAGFAQARARGARALVVAMQASPLGLFSFSGTVAADSGYHGTITQTLLPLVRDAGFPVLLVHGDTHTFRFDQPFVFEGQPSKLQRLEVPGERDVRAVRVQVDLSQPQPFSVRLIEPD